MTSEKHSLRVGAAVLAADDVRGASEITVVDGVIVAIDPCGTLSASERATVATAGLVNAHTHLDLGALARSVPPGSGFLDWVGRVVAARGSLDGAEIDAGVRSSAQALLASGTTSVIDIDSMGRTDAALEGIGLRTVLLREVLDGSPDGMNERSQLALESAQAALSRRGRALRAFGVSPHGTHTVGDELLGHLSSRIADRAAQPREPGRSAAPHAVHWAETPEETSWLSEGSGPFAAWLGPSPGVSGTERLGRLGLLDGSLLIHGNVPADGEVERIAAADRCAVVHCPGSHLFFCRDEFPAPTYVEAGVALALGTDSWASNDVLDMRREVQLARQSLGFDAVTAWRSATETPARWIPWSAVSGRIDVGSAADLAVFLSPGPEFQVLERLTSGAEPQGLPEVVGVMVDGVWAQR